MKNIQKFLKKIIDVGLQIQLIAGALCLLGIIVTITLGIISRRIFDAPFEWTEELGIFLFVWIAFLGTGVSAVKGKHVAIDLLTQKLSPRAAVILEFCLNILILAFLTIMIFGAFKLQPSTMNHKSVTLNIPKNIYYLAPLLSGLFMVVVYIYRNIEIVLKGSDAVIEKSRSGEL